VIMSAEPGPLFNNAAQVWNHTFYWHCLKPGGRKPSGDLLAAIDRDFGSLARLTEQLKDAAVTQFGSGWAWLTLNSSGKLQVLSTANQDSPLMDGQVPLLGLDVWEHAYYLKYQNKRPEYIDAWWNVVDWAKVNELYRAANG